MSDKNPCVYVLASNRNGTIYVGVTSDLPRRISEHKSGLFEGFTKKYSIHLLVHYELYARIIDAIEREKQVKSWSRKKKLLLIEKDNPLWNDLSATI